MDVSSLQSRYLDSCKKHEVLPNSAVLSWFYKAEIQKSEQGKCSIKFFLNQLCNADIYPLIDVFLAIDSSDVDAVDILHESPCNFNEEYVMPLLQTINLKLRVVDLHDMSPEENFLQVANLWTTTAALSKLPSLLELRFQNCLCCKDTGPCPASFGDKARIAFETSSISIRDATFQGFHAKENCGDLLSLTGSALIKEGSAKFDNLLHISEVEMSSCLQRVGSIEISSDVPPSLNGLSNLENKITDKEEILARAHMWDLKNGRPTSLKNYISHHHPSPICFEKHYREYMVVLLPRLEVLDNFSITKMDREMGRTIFSKYYEYLPYKRQNKESVVTVLQKREMGTAGASCPNFSKFKQSCHHGKSQCHFSRSLTAAKLGSAAWPLLHPLHTFSHIYKEGSKRLRARQFEYHPSDSRLMVFGTLDGEVVVINHESGKLVGYVPSANNMNSILGLCWLKKYPSKLLAGSDNGCLKLFDISHIPPIVSDVNYSAGVVTFDDFDQLTSVHVNSGDDQFLASGYSKDVALYDIFSGKRLQLFTNMHREPINVVKFAHHSPFLFATSSFDHDVKLWDLRQKPQWPCYTASSSCGNVMVCFSPDDRYLLVSAVDNEVKQLLAVDGRLHMDFKIASTGSAHNYTRSYYINGSDYIISGSCDENVVRICCTQTGRRLRDVYLEDVESGNSLFVQSLRGDPFRLFHMSVLTASKRPCSKWEIIKVNLLASSHGTEEHSHGQNIQSTFLGG
ncbi:protein DWD HYPERSENSITIVE TO UV-B 1-like isoform X2 [Populus nigra]|uniref:protein DWD HYPERSENSITIVE TO UV-B 1-like isoform X2 n=1 Tax=Populus nigra TaxID=3691 RepID=UPI002B26CD80|nr:protein DWD HYPERSENSITIVE TO UV-B 1-like isoform X2 [Populus nigra]